MRARNIVQDNRPERASQLALASHVVSGGSRWQAASPPGRYPSTNWHIPNYSQSPSGASKSKGIAIVASPSRSPLFYLDSTTPPVGSIAPISPALNSRYYPHSPRYFGQDTHLFAALELLTFDWDFSVNFITLVFYLLEPLHRIKRP